MWHLHLSTAAARRLQNTVWHLLGAITALAILTLLAAIAVPAHAAEASTVNLTPLVDTGFELLSGALVSLLAGIAAILVKKLHIDGKSADADMNRMLHDGIQRGIDLLEGMARARLFKDGKPVTVDVRSEAVAFVANRLVALSPVLIKRLGLTGERLESLVDEALTARGVAAPASAAPAVPVVAFGAS